MLKTCSTEDVQKSPQSQNIDTKRKSKQTKTDRTQVTTQRKQGNHLSQQQTGSRVNKRIRELIQLDYEVSTCSLIPPAIAISDTFLFWGNIDKMECVKLAWDSQLGMSILPNHNRYFTMLYYYGINRIPNSILQTPSQLHTLDEKNCIKISLKVWKLLRKKIYISIARITKGNNSERLGPTTPTSFLTIQVCTKIQVSLGAVGSEKSFTKNMKINVW